MAPDLRAQGAWFQQIEPIPPRRCGQASDISNARVPPAEEAYHKSRACVLKGHTAQKTTGFACISQGTWIECCTSDFLRSDP
jgi:hypothetical protein